MSFLSRCTDCGNVCDYHRPANYDGPDFCQECRSVDTIKEVEDNLSILTDKLNDIADLLNVNKEIIDIHTVSNSPIGGTITLSLNAKTLIKISINEETGEVEEVSAV